MLRILRTEVDCVGKRGGILGSAFQDLVPFLMNALAAYAKFLG